MTREQDVDSSWLPARPIEIVAGTPPGGGLDRVARALVREIEARKLASVAVGVVNVAGDGARRAWTYVDRHPNDAHVVSISSPNLTTDFLVGLAAFDHNRYTPIATLITEYIAFTVRADSPLAGGADLVARLERDAASVTVSLSTALGNINHIAFAKVARKAGGDIRAPRTRVFDTALDVVADVIAGNADVGVVTAASVLAELKAGHVRIIALSAPARLPAPFTDTPTWLEQSVDCVIGAWRGLTGPSGIGAAQIAFWEGLLTAITAEPGWNEELARHGWSPMFLVGAPLRQYLAQEQADMERLLADLGLLGSATTPAPAKPA
jgi:putative tricarboxylic transport membrane protein